MCRLSSLIYALKWASRARTDDLMRRADNPAESSAVTVKSSLTRGDDPGGVEVITRATRWSSAEMPTLNYSGDRLLVGPKETSPCQHHRVRRLEAGVA